MLYLGKAFQDLVLVVQLALKPLLHARIHGTLDLRATSVEVRVMEGLQDLKYSVIRPRTDMSQLIEHIPC